MRHKKAMKWMVAVLLLTLAMAAIVSGTAASPPAQVPESVECGDSITCNTADPTPAVYVENEGTGPSIYGHNTSTGDGVKGRGNPGVYGFSYHAAGVRGKSNQGVGVKGESVGKYGVEGISSYSAGVRAQGHGQGADLILAGDNSTFSDGVISSDPDYSSSDMWLLGYDEVNIVVDSDDDEAGRFQIHDKWSSGEVIMYVNEEGDMYLDDDLHLGHGGSWTVEILATTADDQDLAVRANDHMQFDLDQDNNETSCFYIRDGENSVLWQQCEAKGPVARGPAATAVETNSGDREMYAMGSPELWFEDFGSATLVDGQATITIDPLFAETANLDTEYHVFVQVYGNSDVYVTNRSPSQFEVHLRDGDPNVVFSYRIVARRLGYEAQRLEQVDLTPTEGDP